MAPRSGCRLRNGRLVGWCSDVLAPVRLSDARRRRRSLRGERSIPDLLDCRRLRRSEVASPSQISLMPVHATRGRAIATLMRGASTCMVRRPASDQDRRQRKPLAQPVFWRLTDTEAHNTQDPIPARYTRLPASVRPYGVGQQSGRRSMPTVPAPSTPLRFRKSRRSSWRGCPKASR